MNILVTGARGFVGRGLLTVLAASGHSGTATGRVVPSHLPAGWRGMSRDEVLSGGSRADAIEAIVHLEVKQHCARPTPAEAHSFTTVNVGGTHVWLDWAAIHGVRRFVYLSSIKAVSPCSHQQCEDAPLHPDTPYGQSKALAERAVRLWAEKDHLRSAMILRPAPVYGPGNEANLAAFVRQILAGKPSLVGRGETQKSVVSRLNLAAAIEFVATQQSTGCEVFNVSDSNTLSLNQLADIIAEISEAPAPKRIPSLLAHCVAPLGDMISVLTGRDFPLTPARLKAIHETSIFPCDKLVAAGFSHRQSTREGLSEMLTWMRAE